MPGLSPCEPAHNVQIEEMCKLLKLRLCDQSPPRGLATLCCQVVELRASEMERRGEGGCRARRLGLKRMSAKARSEYSRLCLGGLVQSDFKGCRYVVPKCVTEACCQSVLFIPKRVMGRPDLLPSFSRRAPVNQSGGAMSLAPWRGTRPGVARARATVCPAGKARRGAERAMEAWKINKNIGCVLHRIVRRGGAH